MKGQHSARGFWQLQRFADPESLSAYAAEQWGIAARAAVAARGRFITALAGGDTPLGLYRRLAQPSFQNLPWQHTYCFWGDERVVPPDAPGSNYGQARSVWLDHVPLPPDNCWRIRGELPPTEAAADYALTLARFADEGLAWPRFDLVLLGLGGDGHIASLFPGPPPPQALTQPTLVVMADYAGRPAHRITLTPPVFNSARLIWVLVTGQAKAATLAQLWQAAWAPERWPLQQLQPDAGAIIFLVDEAAASQLA